MNTCKPAVDLPVTPPAFALTITGHHLLALVGLLGLILQAWQPIAMPNAETNRQQPGCQGPNQLSKAIWQGT
ncbi:Uncharacterised protein [Mycobacteroides abscessus subsp. abscessus]|nr:Uncharacterised protein [Mycobacteroides abscessus subsp. abscessus]